MKVSSSDESVQVAIIHSVYKKKRIKEIDDDGKTVYRETERLIKQIPVKKWFKKDCIASVEEYVTNKNMVSKSRSILYDRSSGRFYATFHNAQELWNNVVERNKEVTEKIIGYKR